MSAVDPYRQFAPSAAGPAQRVFAIAPNDAVDLPVVTTGIYVGGTGNVVVQDLHTGTEVTFEAVPEGVILPIRVARVMAATTATALVGLG